MYVSHHRQQLIAPGQAADCIYLISHGELEIYSPMCGPGTEALSLSEPLISGLDMAHLQEQQADADVWDTNTVSDISKEPGGEAWLVGGVMGIAIAGRRLLSPCICVRLASSCARWAAICCVLNVCNGPSELSCGVCGACSARRCSKAAAVGHSIA